MCDALGHAMKHHHIGGLTPLTVTATGTDDMTLSFSATERTVIGTSLI